MDSKSARDKRRFSIHGDNIVECERALELVRQACGIDESEFATPSGSATNPQFEATLGNQSSWTFTFFPGFGRWDQDILAPLYGHSGTITESPDALICESAEHCEYPLFAIEFSGALAAGNQAWQRNGRAYTCSNTGIPFLYIAEIGGSELDSNRKPKAPRFPNPAVPFSYLRQSLSGRAPVLAVYEPNAGFLRASRAEFNDCLTSSELHDWVRAKILGHDTARSETLIHKKNLRFVESVAAAKIPGSSLKPAQWAGAYRAIRDDRNTSLTSWLLESNRIPWRKKTTISSLTASARKLMQLASELGSGLTSRDLPICLFGPDDRQAFCQRINLIYPDLKPEFMQWLQSARPLIVCWVMGFKPTGNDARPDRGLPPLARMLVGDSTDFLTVVFGPGPELHWQLLDRDPQKLAQMNVLWESIMVCSHAVLIDSSTHPTTGCAYVDAHWGTRNSAPTLQFPPVKPLPMMFGEHDVDTVIHSVFARLGPNPAFEGFCNPPGGDWSGISLLSADKSVEARWLSLPRVSGSQSKRPDHVYQLFVPNGHCICVCIESKVAFARVSDHIGQRLTNYVRSLAQHQPNVIRKSAPPTDWQFPPATFNLETPQLVSAAAVVSRGVQPMRKYATRTDVDVVIGIDFRNSEANCTLSVLPLTKAGRATARYLNGKNANLIRTEIVIV